MKRTRSGRHTPMGRGPIAAGAAMVMVIGLAALGIQPAAAAVGDTTLSIEVGRSDGTGPFDGLDADNSNGIVRTNDTVSYTISVRNELAVPGGGQATNPVVSFSLPQGQELVSLPNFCLLPGSAVTPTELGALAPPLDSTSWQDLPVQSVTCRIADRGSSSQTLDYTFVAKMRSEVPNGTTLDDFTATVVSDEFPGGDVSEPVDVTVVAAADYDLSKNGMSSAGDNSGFVQRDTTVCSNPSYALAGFTGCQTLRFPILISVQAGGKGTTPLSTPITFVDDLSPDSFWGAGTTVKPGWVSGLAPSVVGCGIVTGLGNGASLFPYGALPGHSLTTAVRDSGSIDCAANATGPVAITISDTDTTARTFPSTNGTGNVATPADRAFIVSGWITIEYPVAAISAIGELVPNTTDSFRLPYVNEFIELDADDIAGEPIGAEPNTANNARRGTDSVDLGFGFSKQFAGEPGNPTNSGGSGYAAGTFAGPAGSSNGRDGNGIVQAGGKLVSFLTGSTASPPGFGATSTVVCDAWDNSRTALTAAQWRGLTAGTTSVAAPFGTAGFFQQYPSDGASVWMSYYSSVTRPTFTVQYASGSGSIAGTNACLDSTLGWESSPADVAGNDPTLAAQGIFTGVGSVRIVYNMASTLATDDALDVTFSIGLTVLDSVASGDVIGNWAAAKTVYSLDETPPTDASAIADPGMLRVETSYVPAGHTGSVGDRVTVQAAVARIAKQVWNPATSTYVSSGVPIYATGDTVRYRIAPTVTSGVSTGAAVDTYIEDCLPLYQFFVSSSFEGGASVIPDVLSSGAPSGATLACPAGQIYLRWNLGPVVVNSVLPALLYEVTIAETAPNGNLLNTARITSLGDPSSAAARSSSAEVQVVTPTGIKLAKTTLVPFVEVNPHDATNPRLLSWNVQFAVVDTAGVSNPDVIDVLPASGLGGSQFHGGLALVSAAATASTGTPSVLYTAAPANDIVGDPEHPSNGGAGSTVWCDAPSGGSPVTGTGSACPGSADAVTGVRVRLAGAVASGFILDLAITMVPTDNAEGDIYDNSAEANATGVLQGVGPVTRAIAVVGGSIGNYVWLDVNKNGVQDAGEPPIAGLPISISGTDTDGNVITAITTTDAQGRYLFASLPSGTYTVDFDKDWVVQHGYVFTVEGAGASTDADSDAHVISGLSGPVTLGIDEDRLDIDAGLVAVPVVPFLASTGLGLGSLASLGGGLLVLGALVLVIRSRRRLPL